MVLDKSVPAVQYFSRSTIAAGEGRKASEALNRQLNIARPAEAVKENKGVLLVIMSKVDQPVVPETFEEMTELNESQLVHEQQLPLHCEERPVMCDEVTEDLHDSDDFDALLGKLQEEIPALLRSGKITDEEALGLIADEEYYNDLATLMLK